MSKVATTPGPYAVRCTGTMRCNDGKLIHITEEEYLRQMNNPWQTWRCPGCGEDAAWSDDNYEDWYAGAGDHVDA